MNTADTACILLRASARIQLAMVLLALRIADERPGLSQALKNAAPRGAGVSGTNALAIARAAERALAPTPRHLKPRITIRTAWAEGWPPTWEVREPGQPQRKAPGYICVVGLEPGAELWRLLRKACYDIVRQRPQRLRAPLLVSPGEFRLDQRESAQRRRAEHQAFNAALLGSRSPVRIPLMGRALEPDPLASLDSRSHP